MSLITRCPACGTMFKVVADQLKVSQGWVRCGHCSEVFDASLHLQAEQAPSVQAPSFQEDPVQQAPASTDPPAQAPALQPDLGTAQGYGDDSSWTPGVFFSGVQPVAPSPPAGASLSEGQVQSAAYDEFPQRREDTADSVGVDDYGDAVQVLAAQAREGSQEESHEERLENHSTPLYTEDSVRDALSDESGTAPDVSFVRDAKRKAFWRKPAVRLALVACSLLLTLALALQVAVQQRDQIAALQPGLKPWLGMLCEQLHCDVGPLRRIEAVVIDSSTFNKIDGDSYRLSFSLKNTGPTPVAMPSLEVTLTDMQDQAVVRRVLTPAQFGASGNLLVAGADFAGFVVMQVLSDTPAAGVASPSAPPAAPLRVAGYRMLAFYP